MSAGPNPFKFGQNDQYQFAQQPGGYQDPSYQFRLDEGMRNLLANKAAVGGLGSGQTLRDIMNYGQGAASQEYQNAYNRFNTDRSFNYGVSQDDINRAMAQANADRAFQYQVSTGDRSYDLQRLGLEGQLGLQGAQGGSDMARVLATLLSGNLNTLGQIQGTGTMGGNNAWTGALSQIIAALAGNAQANQAQDNFNTLMRRYQPQAQG